MQGPGVGFPLVGVNLGLVGQPWELLTFLPVRCERSLRYKVKLGAVGIKQAQLLLMLLHSSRDPELPRAQLSPRPPGGAFLLLS